MTSLHNHTIATHTYIYMYYILHTYMYIHTYIHTYMYIHHTYIQDSVETAPEVMMCSLHTHSYMEIHVHSTLA